jgi:hemin uptake protein HemP
MATPPQHPPALPTADARPVQQINAPEPVHRISSDELLAGALEVQIEHRGSLYRLRQTSLGKLILTK